MVKSAFTNHSELRNIVYFTTIRYYRIHNTNPKKVIKSFNYHNVYYNMFNTT